MTTSVTLLEQAERNDYDLCINSPLQYKAKVEAISDLFLLKGKDRLIYEHCPVYSVGKRISRFVMIGLNPGHAEVNSTIEDAEARRSWSHYDILYHHNFFRYFGLEKKFRSPYYDLE